MQVAADVMDVKEAFADAAFLDDFSLVQNDYNLTNVAKAEPLFCSWLKYCLDPKST